MDSTRPIRAIQRGLEVLGCLNARDGMTVSEVAEFARLPRTTAYRVLETLRSSGYIVRDSDDDRYRPTVLVRRLAEGFEDQVWIREIARPLIQALGQEIVWPVSITTLHGSAMLLRETTDKSSPLVLERYSAGHHIPIMITAAGQVHLAYCSDHERETLLRILEQSANPDDALSRQPELVERMLRETRAHGYATNVRPHQGENSVAVPILVEGRLLACLTMRYIKTAMAPEKAVHDFLAKLQETARKIAGAYSASRTKTLS